ncbi:MAG: hypothetical protein MRERV_27c030 [Mycoplasmataceae bacterium RV_VA103A]|nr:MAG: hypothetical protein MRERV_27c030 [Mycoplasmataceae bacterium RV_VA103A]
MESKKLAKALRSKNPSIQGQHFITFFYSYRMLKIQSQSKL